MRPLLGKARKNPLYFPLKSVVSIKHIRVLRMKVLVERTLVVDHSQFLCGNLECLTYQRGCKQEFLRTNWPKKGYGPNFEGKTRGNDCVGVWRPPHKFIFSSLVDLTLFYQNSDRAVWFFMRHSLLWCSPLPRRKVFYGGLLKFRPFYHLVSCCDYSQAKWEPFWRLPRSWLLLQPVLQPEACLNSQWIGMPLSSCILPSIKVESSKRMEVSALIVNSDQLLSQKKIMHYWWIHCSCMLPSSSPTMQNSNCLPG